MVERKFNTPDAKKATSFTELVKKNNSKKRVEIKNEYNYGHEVSPADPPTLQNVSKGNTAQGRPIKYADTRYKASKPKKVSPAVDSKLTTMQDYMTELSDLNERVSFNKQIDVLIEYYIEAKLGASKKERLREEINDNFDKL